MFYHVHKIICEKYENLLYLQMQETSTVHEGYSKKLKPIDVVSTVHAVWLDIKYNQFVYKNTVINKTQNHS